MYIYSLFYITKGNCTFILFIQTAQTAAQTAPVRRAQTVTCVPQVSKMTTGPVCVMMELTMMEKEDATVSISSSIRHIFSQ